MSSTWQKETGAYSTPLDVVCAFVKWPARRASDRLLDPSCGAGRFIALHRRSVGVELEAESSQSARERAPGAPDSRRQLFCLVRDGNGTLRVRCGKSSFHPVSGILRQHSPHSTELLHADKG